jgi:hypothetical protein
LPPPGIRQQSLREAFDNTTPRISFNPEATKAILLRWMAICNIPFKAAENTSFRLLAGYLPAVYVLVVLPTLYVYSLMGQTSSW